MQATRWKFDEGEEWAVYFYAEGHKNSWTEPLGWWVWDGQGFMHWETSMFRQHWGDKLKRGYTCPAKISTEPRDFLCIIEALVAEGHLPWEDKFKKVLKRKWMKEYGGHIGATRIWVRQ